MSSDLCQAVDDLGWSYLFRVNSQSLIVTDDGDYRIAQMVKEGEVWSKKGLIFKTAGRLPGYAHAIWDEGCDQPWALITNDKSLCGREYGRRNWEEQAFRDLKSGGWQWQQSRVRNVDHLERLLVLLALAYSWCVALGSVAVKEGRGRTLQKHQNGSIRRYWSLFKEGLQYFSEIVLRRSIFITLEFYPDHRLA